MDFPIRTIRTKELFPFLSEIPDPPNTLTVRGTLPPPETRYLAVVGSRNYTNYGKQVTEFLIHGLSGYPISIVSGLALGIDAIAHESALREKLHTLAIPGSGIDDSVLYPHRHRGLAERILNSGGALVSEFDSLFTATPWSFPKRNRIMAGISHATLLIEAEEQSGTLITARLTADYNRELLVVPGDIFSSNSKGTHQFLKLGARLVTSPEDILDALTISIATKETPRKIVLSGEEQMIITILDEPKDQDAIIRLLPYQPETTLMLLMQMELAGHIHEQNGVFFKII